MKRRIVFPFAALLVGAAFIAFSERTTTLGSDDGILPVDSLASEGVGTNAPHTPFDRSEVDVQGGRQGVSIKEAANPEVDWWADTDRLNSYYSKFEKIFAPARSNWGAGFEDGLARLQQLDRKLQQTLGKFPNRVDWAELGELGGPEAIFVAGVLQRWEREDPPTRRGLQQLYFEGDPFGVKPHCLLSYLSEKEIALSSQQTEEVQRIFYTWIGERARLEQSFHAFTADIVARQQGDGSLMAPFPEGSELRPAELAHFEDSQAQIFNAYREALANFLTKEGIEVTLWRE